MAYLLIFDLKGGNTAGRRRVNRYLRKAARRVQQSVWEFKDLRALMGAARLISAVGGRAMAFVRGDALVLEMSEVRQVLSDASGKISSSKGRCLR
ncbi:MAG: hypothetical protein QMC89_00155 [Candidatus Hodarchaeaceae archaeon]|nr:hypothetical protein [Candidatus Hodarchaeaceae archaeon]